MPPDETFVIWNASRFSYRHGYKRVVSDPEEKGEFNLALREQLARGVETVTFFCDDDIVFRPVESDPAEALKDERVLCHNLSLGRGNAKMRLPDGFPVWNWTRLARHDFGFPCSLNGATYRPADVLKLLGSFEPSTPNLLETRMITKVGRIAKSRPLMAAPDYQSLVSVAVNHTSISQGAPSGRKYPQEAEALNREFLLGQMIDLDAIDFSVVDSVHHEFRYAWTR